MDVSRDAILEAFCAIGGRDADDAMMLAHKLNLRTVEHLAEVVRRNVPHDPLDARKRLLLHADIAARLA